MKNNNKTNERVNVARITSHTRHTTYRKLMCVRTDSDAPKKVKKKKENAKPKQP